MQSDADAVLAEFDDIAIFVFFSVFEAMVRDHVWKDVEGEVSGLRHPALKKVADRMREGIEEGSFYSNVLDLFKKLDHNLIEVVNQVRRYRNWVAHGRREEKKPMNMSPKDTLERLRAFLQLIGHEPDDIPPDPLLDDPVSSPSP